LNMLPKSLLLLSVVLSASLAAADNSLPEAAMRDDREAVRLLLKHNANVNEAQGDGMTALHWASYKGDVELARMLLKAGANVNAQTRIGAITPLFLASKNGSAEMVQVLLASKADANFTNGNGTTALMVAAASGNTETVTALVNHSAEVNAKETAHGQTALMFAAALDRGAVIKVLRDHGADAAALTKVVELEQPRFDKTGNILKPGEKAPAGDEAEGENEGDKPTPSGTPANRVDHAENGPAVGSTKEADKTKSNMPERKKRKFGAKSMGGMTALLFAARDGHMEAAKALVESNAEVNEVSGAEKISPLVMAISNGHYDLAKYLLDHGANPNLATIQGLTALYSTVDVQWAPHGWSPEPITDQEKISYLELTQALIDHGANPNARLGEKVWSRTLSQDGTWVDAAGATAFWRAAQADDVTGMKLLVKNGADPKLATTAGVTPLMVAAGLGWAPNFSINAPGPWLAAVEYCVEMGADVNAADAKGYTALHGSAFVGNNDLINFLAEHHARTDVKTKAGDTIADMANGPIPHSIPHPETVVLLEKLGSPNSHNCRSDQCVVAPKEDKKPAAVAGAKSATKPGN
jgi:ankyrin repeat protein